MSRMVRAALLQATWTGDKESMIQKHEDYARKAAAQGAKVMCFQELFYGPYFAQVQDAQFYAYTELIPDGPTTKRMQDPLVLRNIIHVERSGRFRVRERTVLRYYARTLAHLLPGSRRTPRTH